MSALNEGAGAGFPAKAPAAAPSPPVDEPLLDVFSDPVHRSAANRLLGYLLDNPDEVEHLFDVVDPWSYVQDRWRAAIDTDVPEWAWRQVVPWVAGIATVTLQQRDLL